MIQLINRILIVLATIGLIVFMSLSSFILWEKEVWIGDIQKVERKIDIYRSKVVPDEDSNILEKEKIIANSITLGQNDTLYVEFGRLASAMFTDESKTLDTNIVTLSGRTIIALKEYPGIISFYDPFEVYTYQSFVGDYSIQQITNGSFYIGREKDGTISLYSIDAVIRLEFLHEKNHMTDMLLFPWMYVRFDPKLNRNLAGADLFRIILSMTSTSWDPDAEDRTWVEFVNPRISSSTDADTFFMYRLPTYTRIIFRSLHAEFAGRVKKLNDLKKYASEFSYDIEAEKSNLLSNPSKKNHFLLRELEWLLSAMVEQSKTKEDFIEEFKRIDRESASLAQWNDVRRTLEEFLTDARFASFGTAGNKNFQEIYDEIANILKIAPKWAKAELLQKLSNIYSLNLSAQMKDKEFSRIDTYSPTAREIANTLSSTDIDSKDYFDIALYAFHVLKKAESGGKFFDEAVFANATYELIRTIFLATDRYIKWTDKKEEAYKSISIQFYDQIMNMLVNSVYMIFTEVDEDRIFLKSKYILDNVATLDNKTFLTNIRGVNGVIDYMFSYIDKAYENDSDLRTYLSMKKSKLRLKAFEKLFDKWYYAEYVLNPYVAVKVGEIFLPELNEDSTEVVMAPRAEKIDTSADLPEDVWITKIRNLLGNIPDSNIIKENEYYQVRNAEMQAVNPNDSTTLKYEFSATFSNDLKTISNISILYGDKRMMIVTDTKDQQIIDILSRILPAYLIAIDDIFKANPGQILRWEIRLYIDKSRIAIGTNIFSL